ncbi:HK97 family phage prohead protease [Gemella sanguinis]|uniref:HK97 family phage prohead protease n=1 Tax=Gemella sanguinis TaxID=84135 RepID=UPI00352DD897
MKIRVYEDKATISGYVNVAERISKRLKENGIEFYERIKEGAFGDAVRRNNNIKILLNHDYQRELGNTMDNLTVYEDSIGLFAEAEITDKEVVQKARENKLSGWSFGFIPLKEDVNENYGNIPLRTVESLNLYEVSILDNDHIPAYNSMSLNVRDVGTDNIEIRSYDKLNIQVEEEEPKEQELQRDFDNSIFIAKIDNFLNERK